jgi:hypothetical protein
MKNNLVSWLLFIGLLMTSPTALAHCDTKDGPVVADAHRALEQHNINYVLKWIPPAYEKEIKEAFRHTLQVRVLSPEAEQLADQYFFETLVRIHRSGEGMPFTGLKPAGTPVNEKILAADKAIAVGNLSPLTDLVPKEEQAELKKRFDKVMSLRQFDVNDVAAGRKYIEAYVQFFHFAEGEGEHHPSHLEAGGYGAAIPWLLAGIFFLTSAFLGSLYYRKYISFRHNKISPPLKAAHP